MSENCEYCNKNEDCCCIEGIDYHKCHYCKAEFKTGEGYDKEDCFCSEKCYENAEDEGWME